MIKVDPNIPMPAGRIASRKYPWREMAIGDSFFIPDVSRKSFSGPSLAAKRTGFKFTVRTVEGGLRVWRFA